MEKCNTILFATSVSSLFQLFSILRTKMRWLRREMTAFVIKTASGYRQKENYAV